jgi:predicted transcriptional regulator
MSNLLDTLSNTTRLKIIECLSQKPKNVTEIVNVCGISQSAVSQHLAKLKESGIIDSVKKGREIVYHVKVKSASKLPKVLKTINAELNKITPIKYIQFNDKYINQVHELILNCIDTLNTKDYTTGTIEIMKSWQNIERLSKKISEGFYILGISDNEVVGIGGLVKKEVCTMFVHPAYTKRGIGKNIFNLLEIKAREKKLDKIGLSSTLTAKEFYLKCGFEEKKRTIHKLDGNDFEVFEMEKVIK